MALAGAIGLAGCGGTSENSGSQSTPKVATVTKPATTPAAAATPGTGASPGTTGSTTQTTPARAPLRHARAALGLLGICSASHKPVRPRPPSTQARLKRICAELEKAEKAR